MSKKELIVQELYEMPLIDAAFEILSEKKEAMPFTDIVDILRDRLNLSKDEIRTRIAQFYTDLNIDGRFLCIGDNHWGIRTWYPFEKIEDDIVTVSKPKKKKSKLSDEDDDFEELLEGDFDEIEEEFDDIDELDEEDEEDEEEQDEYEEFVEEELEEGLEAKELVEVLEEELGEVLDEELEGLDEVDPLEDDFLEQDDFEPEER